MLGYCAGSGAVTDVDWLYLYVPGMDFPLNLFLIRAWLLPARAMVLTIFAVVSSPDITQVHL
jgi:hypothetical protein